MATDCAPMRKRIHYKRHRIADAGVKNEFRRETLEGERGGRGGRCYRRTSKMQLFFFFFGLGRGKILLFHFFLQNKSSPSLLRVVLVALGGAAKVSYVGGVSGG